VAYANTPLTSGYLGTDYLTMTGWDGSYTGCGSEGCGGEFGGAITLNGGTQSSNTTNTNFWCIDAQEDFSWGNSGYADVVQLTNVTADALDVSYSNVGNSGDPVWTYTPSNSPLQLPSSAQARFEMAAWLVQQYSAFPNSVGTSSDNAIQLAIWDITSNSTGSVDDEYAPSPAQDPAAWVWVQDALSCYTTSCSGWNPGAWAVVSWATSPSGSLGPPPNHQTFLVQLVPEPGFYGLLGLGVIGLIFGALHKKKKARTQPVAV
jgi:hypothetical protein